MANQPKFPARTVRVPDDLWDAARELAESRGDNVSNVLRDALRRYVARNQRDARLYGKG